jgi:transposase
MRQQPRLRKFRVRLGDCLQVSIALVVTRDGMPLGYEILPGHTADVSTVEDIVAAMERCFGRANCVWVMDRGMVSTENIAWLNETGGGTHKSNLAIRPIWHRRAECIKAHILVCFLGCALWNTLQQWQSRAGLGDSSRNMRTELSRTTAADVVLPLADGTARELRVRRVARPDPAQALLIDRMGLIVPEPLRAPQIVSM